MKETTRLSERNFDILSAQAVLMFSTPITGYTAATLFKKMPAMWEQTFDGPTDFFPHGGDIPVDAPLPLFQMKNQEQSKFLTVTRQRVELITKNVDGERIELASVMSAFAELFNQLIGLLPVETEVNRLAAVVQRISREEFTAAMLAEEFCSPAAIAGPYRRPATLELHSHKVFKAKFGTLNSWVRQRSKRRSKDNSEVVLIEQDMNTILPQNSSDQDDVESFGPDDVTRFFSQITAELDDCFHQYYPDGECE